MLTKEELHSLDLETLVYEKLKLQINCYLPCDYASHETPMSIEAEIGRLEKVIKTRKLLGI